MRRALLSSLALLTVSLAVMTAAGTYHLDAVIKNGIERAGPRLTGAPVTVGEVAVSPLAGELRLRRLRVGDAFTAELIRIRWASLLTDTIRIEEFHIGNPTLVYQFGARSRKRSVGGLNWRGGLVFLALGGRLDGAKYRIDRFRISGGKFRVDSPYLGKRGVTLDLPEVDLRGIGALGGGASPKQAAAEITRAVKGRAFEAVRRSKQEDIRRFFERFREQVESAREEGP